MSVRLVCGNCGTIETHESFKAAEDRGWDTVLIFGYNACPDCLGVSVYFPMLYCQQARELEPGPEREMLIAKAAAATRGDFGPYEDNG